MEPDLSNTLNLKEQATTRLDDLKWGDRMSPQEIENKVMEQLPENHKEVLKQLKQEQESILGDDSEKPISQPENDINVIKQKRQNKAFDEVQDVYNQMFVDDKMHEQLKLPEFRVIKKEVSEVSQSMG